MVAFGVIVQIGYVTFELKTKLFDNLKVAYTLEIPTTLAFAIGTGSWLRLSRLYQRPWGHWHGSYISERPPGLLF